MPMPDGLKWRDALNVKPKATLAKAKPTPAAPDSVLDAPAIDTPGTPPDDALDDAPVTVDTTTTPTPSTPAPAPAAPAPVTPAAKPAMVPNPAAAKRALVLHSARNSETGLKLFAGQLRREYGVKPSEKMSDHDVLQAAYDLSAKDEPNLSPDTFMRDLHSAYGDTVDKALLRQAHEDFPGTDSETDLIDKLYKAKIRNEELPPITYEDKAQILARRYPDLHKSALEPDTALKQVYTLSKAEGKVEGSYNDWLHEQAAPTLYEKVLALGGGLARGLKGQAVDVARFANTLSNAYSNPASLASDVALATQAGDSKAGQDAKARLISAGKGALVAGSFAAGPLVGGGLEAAEGALGLAKTAPLLSNAAEGAAIGGTQGGGEAAIEGKPLGEIAAAATGGAGAGAGVGAIAGLLHGHMLRGPAMEGAEAAAEGAAAPAPLKVVRGAADEQIAPGAPSVPKMTPEDDATMQSWASEHIEQARAERQVRIDKLTQAIKDAAPVRAETEKLMSAERSRRFGRAMGAMESTGGEGGYHSALGELKGALPKAQFEPVRQLFSQDEVDALFDHIANSDLPPGDRLTSMRGLSKLLGSEATAVPTEGELALLKRVYGDDFVKTILSKRSFAQKAWAHAVDALNIPRSVMSSMDFSAPFRQGLFLSTRGEFWKALPDMFKAFGSESAYRSMQADIEGRMTYDAMRAGKLAVLGGEPEELFLSKGVNRIPILGPLKVASERAFTGFLHKVRADVFDSVMRDAAAAGEDTSSQKFVTDLATWVNRSSGRGTLPEAMESADKLLAGTFFAPRLTASRVQVFTHVLAYEPFVRKQAIKGLLGTLGAVGTISGLSVLAGGKVSLDPTNTDFLKVRFGNTRFDFLGGHQQIFRMLAQMVTGKVTSSTTGKMMDLNAPGAKMNRADIALRFLESKMSPAASFVLTALSGKDYIGRPVSIPNEVLVRLTPLIVNDISDALQEYHGLHGPAIAVAPLALVGIGTQTYEPTLPKSVAGPQQPQWGPAMQLYRHLTGEDQIATLKLLTPQRANDYAKDAALANTLGQAEATRVPGFAKLPKETQTKVINKMVERRMKPLRTLWATRLGQHGEQARLRAEASFDRQRANILK